jgi:hypothetical protein
MKQNFDQITAIQLKKKKIFVINKKEEIRKCFCFFFLYLIILVREREKRICLSWIFVRVILNKIKIQQARKKYNNTIIIIKR